MLCLPTCAAKIVEMYILRGAVRRFMCKYNTFMSYCQTNIVRFLCISSAVVVAAGCQSVPSHRDELNLAILTILLCVRHNSQ